MISKDKTVAKLQKCYLLLKKKLDVEYSLTCLKNSKTFIPSHFLVYKSEYVLKLSTHPLRQRSK